LNKQIPWSYSRLNSFETCPKKFYQLSVAKNIKEKESEAMRYGREVHKAIELRISKDKPLPINLQHIEPVIAKFASANGQILVEQQLALNVNLEPTGWFDKDVWCRAIVDYAVVNKSRALIVDWKTGQLSDDFTQQKVAAAIFLRYFPEVAEIDMMYYWLKDKKPTHETLQKEDVKHVWSAVLKRVRRYQQAHIEESFPPRPSGLCKKHCPVTSCPHHGVG